MTASFVVILMIWLNPSRSSRSLVLLLASSLTSPYVFSNSLPQVTFPTPFPPIFLLLSKGLCSWVPLLVLLTTVHQLSRKEWRRSKPFIALPQINRIHSMSPLVWELACLSLKSPLQFVLAFLIISLMLSPVVIALWLPHLWSNWCSTPWMVPA